MWYQMVCLLTGVACSVADVPGHPSSVVTVQIANPSNTERENVPVTFGQVFRRGDIQRGIVVRADDRAIPAQIDVKIERLLPNHRQVMAREPFWAIRPASQ